MSTDAEQRAAAGRQAREHGHQLGPWQPAHDLPTGPPGPASVATCTVCGATVTVHDLGQRASAYGRVLTLTCDRARWERDHPDEARQQGERLRRVSEAPGDY